MLTVIADGARSGKSILAKWLATRSHGPVAVIATAEALNHEMEARIRAHEESRNKAREVVGQPIEFEEALRGVPSPGSPVVTDCLTL